LTYTNNEYATKKKKPINRPASITASQWVLAFLWNSWKAEAEVVTGETLKGLWNKE